MIEYAYTDKAKEEIRDITPYMSESKLKAKLRETTEARLILEKQGNPPMTSLVEIKEYIQLAEVGGCLNGSQYIVYRTRGSKQIL